MCSSVPAPDGPDPGPAAGSSQGWFPKTQGKHKKAPVFLTTACVLEINVSTLTQEGWMLTHRALLLNSAVGLGR